MSQTGVSSIRLSNLKSHNKAKSHNSTASNITPKISTDVPKPPSYLTACAKKHWKTMYPILQENGVITEMDLPMFTQLCSTYGQIEAIEKELNQLINKEGKRGLVGYLEGQNSQTTPLYTALSKAQSQYEKFAAKFGMTPGDRKKVKIEQPKEKSEFERFLEGDDSEDEVLHG